MSRRDREFRRSWAHYCAYCGSLLCQSHRKGGEPNCLDEATWDHIVPHLNGKAVLGRDKVVACHWCNNDRGDRTVPKWKRSVIRRWRNGHFKEAPIPIRNKAAAIYLGETA